MNTRLTDRASLNETESGVPLVEGGIANCQDQDFQRLRMAVL